MKENIVKSKSFSFAVRIVKLYQYLLAEKKEYVLSKQLLRSGTAVGAMIREAEQAESKNDFIHKLGVAQKEINESIYWLELMHETSFLNEEQFESINKDATELIRLLTSIIKATKANIKTKSSSSINN